MVAKKAAGSRADALRVTGPRGPRGLQGITGAAGPAGPAGPPGPVAFGASPDQLVEPGNAVGDALADKAPAVVAPELSPYQYGATGGDPVADRAGLNAAFAAGVAQNRPVQLQGTLALSPISTTTFSFGNRGSDYSAHICVSLLSGLQVYGRDATIIMKPGAFTPGANQRVVLFGSPLSVAAGVITDVLFDDITIDFRDEFGAIPTYSYAFGAMGVDRFERRNIKIISTGTRAGRGIWTENCRFREDHGIRHRNIVQGMYLRYDDDYTAHDLAFDTFTEGVDIDGPCLRPSMSKMRFVNGQSEAQCIDASGVKRGNFSDIVARSVKSIFYVYDKPDAYSTYSGWLLHNNDDVAAPLSGACLCEDVALSNVRADGLLTGGDDAIRVANERDETGNPWMALYPPIQRISLSDINIEGGNRVIVNECGGISIRGLRLTNMSPGTDSDAGAALIVKQSAHDATAITNSLVSGSVNDVRITNCQGGGANFSGLRDLVINDISVLGYNLQASSNTNYGVKVQRPSLKGGGLEVGKVTVSGGPANCVDFQDLDDAGAASAYRHSLKGPFSLRSVASGAVNIDVRTGPSLVERRVIPLEKVDLTTGTGVASKIVPLLHDDRAYYRVVYAAVIVPIAIAGDAVNYSFARLRRSRAGVQTSLPSGSVNIDNVARAADTEIAIPFTLNDATTLIEPGDTLLLDLSRGGGTGSTLGPLALVLGVVPFTKT